MNDDPKKDSAWWVDVIHAARTSPLGLLALIVLVINGILAYEATQATGLNQTFLIIGPLITMLVLVGVVAYIAYKTRNGLVEGNTEGVERQVQTKYDVFVSAPMAGYKDNPEKYGETRESVMKIIDTFQNECEFSVVYAGRKIESPKDFEAPNISVEHDFLALKESKFFLLFYPERVVSSVIFEAGWGLALNKPSIYFVRDRNHLPFLMAQASQAFQNVKMYEYNEVEDVLKLIRLHKKELFPEK